MTVGFFRSSSKTWEGNMLFLCIVLQYFILIIATNIEFYELNNTVLKSINVSQKVLTRNTISALTENIHKITYFGGSAQITAVTDLPELRNLAFEGVGQEVIPLFRNLPKLETVSLERNELVFVPQDRFNTLPVVYVHLRMNKIQVIEDGSFGRFVKHIYMSCNMLRSIESRWFQNPARVEVLDFDANNIVYLPENSLRKFTALSYLYLLHNRLKVIGTGAFPNRNFFSELWFGYNDLTEIDASIFGDGNITVEWLDISFNKLTFLSTDFMDKIRPIDTPLIDGNPWQCPCYYYQIIRWIPWGSYGKGVPKDRPGEPRCAVAKGVFSNRCVPMVFQELIDIFRVEATPPPQTREEYCQVKTG